MALICFFFFPKLIIGQEIAACKFFDHLDSFQTTSSSQSSSYYNPIQNTHFELEKDLFTILETPFTAFFYGNFMMNFSLKTYSNFLSQNFPNVIESESKNSDKAKLVHLYISITIFLILFVISIFSLGYIYTQSTNKTKLAHEHLRNKQEELLKANQELKEVNYRLEQFSQIAAHDMKNSIVSIKGMTNYLFAKSNFVEREDAEFLEYINTETKKLKDFIDYLLFSAKQYHTKNYRNEDVNLNEVFEEVNSTLAFQINDLNASVTPCDLLSIRASYFSMYQLFLNMIDNSLKYHNPNDSGEIEISVYSVQAANGIKIYFEDNGKGMTPEEKEKATTAYYQLINQENTDRGVGLGLHICAQIVRDYEGSITIESELNKGTKIIVFLKTEMIENEKEELLST